MFEAPIDKADEDNMPTENPKQETPAFDAAAEIAALRAELVEVKALAAIVKVVQEADEPKAEDKPQESALSAEIAELKTLLKTFAAAPPTDQPAAPVNEPEAAPEPPKAYTVARKEAIGDATGLARIAAVRAFEKQFPNEAAYIASFSK